MKFLVILFLFLQITLSCNLRTSFDDDDPSLFHHVNVITGHLNLSFQDTVVEGGMPLPIVRSYSSGGALQHAVLSDPTFGKGWRIYPHIRLDWEGLGFDDETLKIYLLDKGGNPVKYSHKKKNKDKNYLFPVAFSKKRASSVCSRKNPERNYIKINTKTRTATLFAADGSVFHYSDIGDSYGYLQFEILPSKHRIYYTYEDHRLSRVQLRSPKKSKVLAEITFTTEEKEDKTYFTAHTSDGKTLTYQLFTYDGHDYIEDVKSDCRPREHYCYEGGRKGIGARVSGMEINSTDQFIVEYYRPKDKKAERKWADKIPKKNYSADKVSILKAPLGPEGKLIPIGTFNYEAEYTDVRDVDNLLIRYHHTNNKLNAIEYFDNSERLHSVIKFFWKKDNLKTKSLFDSKGVPLFAKVFQYDEKGRVIQENFHGSFSGLEHLPLIIDSEGEVHGGECVTRNYKYFGKLIEEEEEVGGLTTHYSYLPDTDLLVSKMVSKNGEVKLREFYQYDSDHLLISEIIDDGSSSNLKDLTSVTERRMKTYDRSPDNGLCQAITQSYLDLSTNELKQLIRQTFTYNTRCRIETETIFDSSDQKRYTLTYEYDNYGNIKRKTTPLGLENTYLHDSFNNLIESKEIGQLKKRIGYDKAGRPIRVERVDLDGNEKIDQTTYDAKGRPLVQIDSKGNSTTQAYDDFGNCTAIYFPDAFDEDLNPYTPIATFAHDIQGNIISHSNPEGYCTLTSYNTFRKPILIKYPDGAIIRHIYNYNGTLAKTIHPDGTEDHYTYDVLDRQDSKTVYSSNGNLLSFERWIYNTFHLLSYTNPEGLNTLYTYNGAGRKIAEQAENRIVKYHYDPLGHLERTVQEDHAEVCLRNVEGDIIQQWEEGGDGTVENFTAFFYDAERHKEKAIRRTSQGDAVDFFAYDSEGRLCAHTDPHGEVIQFIYLDEAVNDLGQRVQTKNTIDQLGNQTIETFDALNRLVQIEKSDPNGTAVSRERIFYDRSGNQAEKQVTIFQGANPKRTYSCQWSYDSRGRVLKEVEENKKITTFAYDKKGRLKRKKHSIGIEVFYEYDGLDRLISLYSSDLKLRYRYRYGCGPSPIEAIDNVNQLLWKRTYNSFGEITSETSPTNSTLSWDYDGRGRCTQFSLMDGSAITYTYNDLHLTQIIRLSPAGAKRYAHSYTQFDENGHIAEEDSICQLGPLSAWRDLLERPIERLSAFNRSRTEYGPSGLIKKTDHTLFGSKKYEYDSLNQLCQEGSRSYHFDSLGNPINAEVNQLNQISHLEDTYLIYDANGNPTQRLTPQGATLYSYDPLNRLISIEKPGKPKVEFLYDPFFRLYNQTSTETRYFLYDRDIEIGCLDDLNNITQLKVVGIGIKGDIGAAVALELNGQVYAPLHDFSGSIIGLVSSNGKMVESYDISAFGQENCSREPINPWRFNSKRAIEGFVFFGQRFYDPELGRWLTPDPAGFIDGLNLYLYVHNSPLNRLDLFGLDSAKIEIPFEYEGEFYHNAHPNFQIYSVEHKFIPMIVTVNDIKVDCIISSNVLHVIKPTPEEIMQGKIDFLAHFHEIFPKVGQFIAITSFGNGVNTNFEEHKERVTSIMNMIDSAGHIIMGIHTPTDGILQDVIATVKEMKNVDTPMASITRQVLVAIAETLHKVNPELIHLHIAHSRGGATYNCAFNGMTPDQKDLIKTHLYFVGVGPASPISKRQAMETYNFYSKGDGVTGRFGRQALRGPNRQDFTIQFLDRTLHSPLKEHSILEPTYQQGLKNQIDKINGVYSFYGN